MIYAPVKTIPLWLEPDSPNCFPAAKLALSDPNGLLAIGGDLSPERLLAAYRHGIFPWYETGQPIIWWSPDPRALLEPTQVVINRSLKKRLRQQQFSISVDLHFDQVITGCAAPRSTSNDSWITEDMQRAYRDLHQLGHAHSVEVWEDGELVGGLYGIAIGRIFCGESMFSRTADASKVALLYLCHLLNEIGFEVIDCQLPNPHLTSMGCQSVARDEFLRLLEELVGDPEPEVKWQHKVSAEHLSVKLL